MAITIVNISDIFDYYPGNHGLTEETIYNHQPLSIDNRVPIFSGSENNIIPIGFIRNNAKNKEGKGVVYFEGSCLILTKDGSAGLLTYKDIGIFTINHHACVLKIKKGWKRKVDVEWFAQQYQKKFQQYVTSKSDNRVFSTEWFDRILFEIPDYNIQLRQKNKKKKLDNLIESIKYLIYSLKQISTNSNMVIETTEFHILKNIFHFEGGNSGLTEDFVYYNQPRNELESVPVFSGATFMDNLMGYIFKNARPNDNELKIFVGPAILVVRKGIAGQMSYMDRDRFTTNDDAYVLTVKQEWTNKINLRWFMYQYQELFYNLVTSKSDNATFNKEYAEKQKIKLLDIKSQESIAGKLLKIDMLIKRLEKLVEQIKKLMEYEIT